MTTRAETDSGRITIEDLAARTGMTVRNIRAHQSRGLLNPPRVVGRTGFYDEEHIGRIALIRELQEEGFNLEAIKRILDRAGGSSGDLLNFTRTVREPYEDERPEILEATEIAEPWGDTVLNEDHMRRAEELGLMRALGDGRYEVLSPKMYAAGVNLAELGVPAEDALDALEILKVRSNAVADVFIEVFRKQVWEPFDRAGRPSEDWPRVQEALRKMRPLATDAFVASFQFAMEEASERAISEAIRRELGATGSEP
ncbi:MAG TPA: MerR family transcriptional regulator [Solirubrobacterales bacterium]|nr:MerR family transcriptional regulator [Solirubrobacterales bacterium]